MSRHGWLQRAASPSTLLVVLALATAVWVVGGADPVGLLRTLPLSPGGWGWIEALTFTPDGESLLVLSRDGAVTSCGTRAGGSRAVLPSSAGPTFMLAPAPDFKTLARTGLMRVVTVWDLASGQSLPGPWEQASGADTSALAYSGTLLAVGDSGGRIQVWDTGGGAPGVNLRRATSPVRTLIFTPGGAALVARHRDGTVVVWDTKSGRPTVEIPPPPALTNCESAAPAVALSPDGNSLAVSWQADRKVRVWDLSSGRESVTLRGDAVTIKSLAYSPDGRMIASGDWFGNVKLWDRATGEELAGFRSQNLQVAALAFSPDQTTLATGGGGEGVHLWDLGQVLASCRRPDPRAPGNRSGPSHEHADLDGSNSSGSPEHPLVRSPGSQGQHEAGGLVDTGERLGAGTPHPFPPARS